MKVFGWQCFRVRGPAGTGEAIEYNLQQLASDEEEGEPFSIHEINGLPVGLLNCYGTEFPELTRRLALNGAKLVVIPTADDESVLLSTGKWPPLLILTYPER